MIGGSPGVPSNENPKPQVGSFLFNTTSNSSAIVHRYVKHCSRFPDVSTNKYLPLIKRLSVIMRPVFIKGDNQIISHVKGEFLYEVTKIADN